MTRIARREARHVGGHDVKIGGRCINIHLARIVYRCEECLGELEKHNAGLRCKNDHNHRGFIHKDEAAKIKAKEEKLLDKILGVYEIVDGQIISRR